MLNRRIGRAISEKTKAHDQGCGRGVNMKGAQNGKRSADWKVLKRSFQPLFATATTTSARRGRLLGEIIRHWTACDLRSGPLAEGPLLQDNTL
jgi:hypothetical protein